MKPIVPVKDTAFYVRDCTTYASARTVPIIAVIAARPAIFMLSSKRIQANPLNYKSHYNCLLIFAKYCP